MEGGQGLGYGGGGGGYSPNPSPSPSHSHSASATSSGTKRGRRMKIDDNNNPHHTHPLTFVAPSQYPHQHHILHSAQGRGHNSHHHPHHLAISSLSDDGSHSHSQLDSMSAANTEGFEEGDEVQEEGDDDEDDNDSLRTFNVSRLQNVRKAGSVPGDGSKNHDSNGNQNNGGKEDGNGGGGKVADHIQTNGAYCAREEALKKEEEAGRLKFEFLYNDGNDQHMIWLIGLKNVFARQLPNMPKDYIVRLLMDRNHKSVVIIKANQVVGGVTYRPYPSQRFGEIAFCAITADEQVKGYGTRLMNHVKQFARERDSLTHFLTYADNNAVGYFLKQGFTKDIQLEKERWHGYIKDYDGAILLECKIDLRLPYTDLPAMVRMQRQALDEKIRLLSNRHLVYTGIEIAKKEAGVPRKPLKVEDVPGLRDAGWTMEQWGHSNYRLPSSVPDGQASRQVLHAFMKSLWKYISEQTDAWPFKEPVDPREVPDYYDIIKDPIDLKTMFKRLESEQYYVTLDMFVADVKRMFSNAKTYNSPETVYYKCANKLETFFRNKLHAGLLNKAQ